MVQRRLLGLVVVVVLAGFAGPLVGAAAPRAQTAPGTPAVQETYVSPTYGYTVTFGPPWAEVAQSSDGGFDQLQVSDGPSVVFIEGVPSADDPAACRANTAASLQGEASVQDFVPAKNTEGEPLAGGDDQQSWAVYDYTVVQEGQESWARSAFVLCHVLVPGQAVFRVIQIVDAAAYNDEIAVRSELLAGISLPTAQTAPTPVPSAGPAPVMSRDELVVFLQRAAGDIDGFWTREFPLIANGAAYQPPQGYVPFDQTITSMCGTSVAGPIDVGVGPHYCFGDLTVYLDLPWHEDELARYGPFPVAEAVAHEVGHHIQNLLGLHVCEMSPCLDPTVLTSQELEVMADCLAGAWSADAEQRGRLGNFDIENNIAQYALSFGDVYSGAADPGAHGRGALRVYWFLAGYYFGARTCFNASEATAALANPDPNATPLPAGTLPPGALRAIGDTYQTGGLTLTITGTEQPEAIGDPASVGSRADGRWVVVYFTVTVDGEEAAPLDYDAFALYDSFGRGFLQDPVATDALLRTGLPGGAGELLQPGTEYNLAMVFDVPDDATGLILRRRDFTYPVRLDL